MPPQRVLSLQSYIRGNDFEKKRLAFGENRISIHTLKNKSHLADTPQAKYDVTVYCTAF